LSFFAHRFVKVLGVTAIAVSSAFAATDTPRVGGLAPKVTVTPKARIVDKIDNTKVTVRKGSHTPRIDNATDMGRVPANTVFKGMKLVLKSSDEQEFALSKLLDQQQDKSHENFHQWLTPDTFAQSFGVHPADLAKVTAWLQDQGFTVNKVMKGSRIIDFTGTSGQVEKAFKTEMHTYMVDGVARVSNASDISIPNALAPVVAGVNKLNNIPKKSDLIAYSAAIQNGHVVSATPMNSSTPVIPAFSFGNGVPFNELVGGSDLAVLYNTAPLLAQGYAGAGFTIGIIGETDVLMSDIAVYRSMFGLPVNTPNVVQVSSDPNTVADDGESDLDLEVSGAMAPKATINFYTANDFFEYGVDSSAVYAVEQNVADTISESYGACETELGSDDVEFYGTLWEQAAAQGQTVFISSGDDGPSTCGTYGQYSVNGLGSTPWNVSVGGTQFNEGTTYNTVTTYPTSPQTAPYWGPTTEAPPYLNALRQIPDQPWNESVFETTAANFPMQPIGYIYGGLTAGGSGISYYWQTPSWQAGYGVPTSDTSALAQPIAGSNPATLPPYGSNGSSFADPGPHRYMPDVALNAAVYHDGTVFCSEGSCQMVGNNLATSNYCYGYGLPVDTLCNVGIVGGTSVASPTMAGAQAVIDSYLAGVNATACKAAGLTTSQCGRQGNANFYYYAVANAQNKTACISGSYTGTGVCGFHDSQKGNTEVPNKARGTNTGPYIGWNTAPGYDLAIGLGSPDVTGLAYAWKNVTFNATTTGLNFDDVTSGSATPPITGNHADTFEFLATVYPVNSAATVAPTGDVVIEAQAPGLLNFNYYDATNGLLTLQYYGTTNGNSSASVSGCIGGGLGSTYVDDYGDCLTHDGGYYLSWSGMPGGTYNVYAHYSGDTVYGGSYSPTVAVNIGAEASQLVLVPYSFSNGGATALSAPYTYTYGQGIYIDGFVTDAVGISDGNYGNITGADGQPTGNVTFGLTSGSTVLPSMTTAIDTTDDFYFAADYGTSNYLPNYPSVTAPAELAPGTYTLTATYPGDASFSAATATPVTFTIGPATKTLTLTSATTDASTTAPSYFYATMTTVDTSVGAFPASGVSTIAPQGTVTYTDTTANKVLGTSTMINGATSFIASAGAFQTTGTHVISATFTPAAGVAGGAGYYNAATAKTINLTVDTAVASSVTLTPPAATTFGTAAPIVATVTPTTATGTVYFYDSITGVPVELGTATLSATTHTATYNTSTALIGGTHIITASYGGSTTVSPSNTAASVNLVVNKAPAFLNLNAQYTGDIGYNTVTVNGVTTTVGDPMQVQFNSTIFPNSSTRAPAVTPTGTFSFYADYVSQASPGTLLNPVGVLGQYQPGGYDTFMATAYTTLLTPGTHTLTAVYNGDTNYAYSVSDTLPVSVGLTTLPMTSSATNIGVGEAITFTATITPVTSTVSKIGGTVTFYDNGTALIPTGATTAAVTPVNGTLTTSGTAVATIKTTLSTAGTHTITAVYSGDTRFYTSSGSVGTSITAVTPAFTLYIDPASPTSLTIPRGTSGSFNIDALVVGNWTGTAPLVCLGLPANSYCTFTFPSTYNPPSYFTFNGTDGVYGPVQVTITTLNPHVTGAKGSGLLWFPALLLAGLLGLRRKQLSSRQRQLLLLAVLLCGSLATTACSSLGFATTTGSYTVQVQANGVGSTSASPNIQPVLNTPLTLTVQ
jgi:hypothetical protein